MGNLLPCPEDSLSNACRGDYGSSEKVRNAASLSQGFILSQRDAPVISSNIGISSTPLPTDLISGGCWGHIKPPRMASQQADILMKVMVGWDSGAPRTEHSLSLALPAPMVTSPKKELLQNISILAPSAVPAVSPAPG